jgi:Trp operon repressor
VVHVPGPDQANPSERADMAANDSIPEIRDVPGYPGYGVSADGRAWSRRQKVRLKTGRGFRTVFVQTWHELRQATERRMGYKTVSVCMDGGRRTTRHVHVLVLTAFRGPKPEGMEARHLDGNPANNALGNLAWGTRKENMADKVLHGTAQKGERNGNSVLTEERVREIRGLLRTGVIQAEIARQFGVSQVLVSLISRGKNWAHVK